MADCNAGVLGPLTCPLAFGLLRLAIADRPTAQEAIALIHFALDSGIRLLDTADTYCLNDKELHYGERLAVDALASWHGPKSEVKVLTKVGMARPKGKWVPAGAPQQLARAVDGSLKAFGVEQLFLVQLHATDSRVPLETTLSGLAELQRAGKIKHLGLCNVTPAELRQAQRHFVVASVQNELSVIHRTSAHEGMLALTRQLNIPFLAYRPLGGYANVEKINKNRGLAPLAKRLDCPPHEIALAALWSLGDNIIPLVGARRLSSLQASLAAVTRRLVPGDMELLESKARFAADPEALAALAPRIIPTDLPSLEPNAGPMQGDSSGGEVVLLMGIQGAGKSALVDEYSKAGYARLNRDLAGGKLGDLIPELKSLLRDGARRVVLDNTYPTRLSREPVIAAAHEVHLPARCRYLATPATDARFNVALRILTRYGRLLGPADLKELAKADSNLPPPVAMQRWLDSFEPPALDEGFSAVDRIEFVRRVDPTLTKKGLLLDVDGTIRTTKSGEIYPRMPEDIELLPRRREGLLAWVEAGYKLFFVSNQSGVHSGKLTAADAEACFQRTVELLDLPVDDVVYCPHPAFPAGCFCRKPFPGLAVQLMMRHRLSPQHWIMVGDMDSDVAFARGIGARYYDASEFFAESPPPVPSPDDFR